MKALDLIKQLETLVAVHGDIDVTLENEYASNPFDAVSTVQHRSCYTKYEKFAITDVPMLVLHGQPRINSES